MCFEFLDNLHTNLGNEVENLKIRSRDDNRCESAKIRAGVVTGVRVFTLKMSLD